MKLGSIGEQVRATLLGAVSGKSPPSSFSKEIVRAASIFALVDSHVIRRGPGSLVRDAMNGAFEAMNEIGGEAGAFVRDAVIGVIQGTAEVARITTPVVRDAVEGAVQGSSEAGADISTAGRNAVEGAIQGAVSVGVSTEVAAMEASRGVMEVVLGAGADLSGATRAVVSGVISGVSGAGGDIAGAARISTRQMIRSAASARADAAMVAESAVEAAAEYGKDGGAGDTATAYAVVAGAIEAAYETSDALGDAVRVAALGALAKSESHLHDGTNSRQLEIADQHSVDIERRHRTWRGRALWRASRLLLGVGGIDLAASLAFFTLLSLIPLIAIIVLVLTTFVDQEVIRNQTSELFLYYFPASQELLDTAFDRLFEARLPAGIVAAIGIVLGANGLFMAVNRAVNRIFGSRPRPMLGSTLVQIVIAFVVALLFLFSIGMTVIFQVALNVSEGVPAVGESVSGFVGLVTRALSTLIPLLLTALVFAIVYRAVPNRPVSWRDATFGAIGAVILFEAAKYIFFWFGNIAIQRSVLYGPLSSAVILLVWSYVAGLIFLFGASLANQSASVRPAEISSRLDRDSLESSPG